MRNFIESLLRGHSVAKSDPNVMALNALGQLLADPAPRVLHGSKSARGVFPGAGKGDKEGAKFCLDQGWLEPTGEYEGKGRSRKETYRLTDSGLQAALNQGDPSTLLQSLLD